MVSLQPALDFRQWAPRGCFVAIAAQILHLYGKLPVPIDFVQFAGAIGPECLEGKYRGNAVVRRHIQGHGFRELEISDLDTGRLLRWGGRRYFRNYCRRWLGWEAKKYWTRSRFRKLRNDIASSPVSLFSVFWHRRPTPNDILTVLRRGGVVVIGCDRAFASGLGLTAHTVLAYQLRGDMISLYDPLPMIEAARTLDEVPVDGLINHLGPIHTIFAYYPVDYPIF